ncbi:DEK domain-containing chromatin-associated protein 4 isoform X2 [Lactuca sativa]|uniref:DEK domain-containing chromatin-associated protein 4 isoform X2 n=1 Tax=Lactuca sativa TaxID=4236 RepID=UPI001C691EBA|nr:DEK domain-containing chromatin-associated protein 4 isoform X2 [Lactuca sativa]
MGKEEANTEVGKTVANGTKPDNAVSENTKDEGKDKSKEVNVDKVDAKEKEINDSKEETESEAMEVDDLKEKEDKGSKKHARKKGGVEKGNNNNKNKASEEKKEDPKTPVARAIDRPVRERKSVERLVAVIEKDTAREFHIEKGRGTALKDIPNVAFKLSKKKVSDDVLKLLHTVLFGRRGKALLVKSNILRFSGFVWHENEEKQKAKVQEKLDKYKKEKLFEFCDLLDIPIVKTSAKKEDVVVKLIDFLLLPHITTSELVSEKEQPSKGSKRKKSASSSSKKSKSAEGSEEEEEEEEEDHEKVNGGPEKSESEGQSGEEGSKKRKLLRGVSKKPSSKKDSASINKSKQKETQIQKKPSKSNKDQVPTSTSTSRKKKSHEEKPSTSKEKTGKKAVTETMKEEKQKPSDNELKAAVCEILKQVDFNTATFTDILKLLGKRFNTDLTPRKATIKLMIQDELTKLADVTDDDNQQEEGGAVKTPKQASATKA